VKLLLWTPRFSVLDSTFWLDSALITDDDDDDGVNVDVSLREAVVCRVQPKHPGKRTDQYVRCLPLNAPPCEVMRCIAMIQTMNGSFLAAPEIPGLCALSLCLSSSSSSRDFNMRQEAQLSPRDRAMRRVS